MKDETYFGFCSLWFCDPEIRIKERLDVFPNPALCPPDVYNLWRPFACESMLSEYTHHQEGLDYFLNHLKILAGNDECCYEFIKLWIAQMIQHPDCKSVALWFISEQGTGKGLLMQFLANMLGKKKVFECTNPGRDIWGQFNSEMKEAFLVNLNEIGRKDFFDGEGQVKSYITDPEIVINEKGKQPYKIKSFHRWIGTTNSEEPIPTKKGDRRNVVIRCSDEKKGDLPYFKQGFDFSENLDAVRTIYDYFKTLEDVPRKITESIMPVTKYHKELQELNREPISLFAEHLAQEAENFKRSNLALFDEYRAWCHLGGYKCDYMNVSQFGTRSGMKIEGVVVHAWKEDGRTVHGKQFNVGSMQKHFGIGQCMIDVS